MKSRRLREASKVDASLNAVIILDMYAKAAPYVIDETMEEIRSYFSPYFADIDDDCLRPCDTGYAAPRQA